MIIQAFPSGPFSTNAYVVSCPATKRTAIIDPAPDSAQSIIKYIEKNSLIPDKILLTHSHWDHIADASILKAKYNIPIYIHQEDAGNLENPGSDGLPCWINIAAVKPDEWLLEGTPVFVGDLKFEVIHTPGHTPGGVCFYCKEHNLLLSGDTLFQGTIGNLSFPTGRPHLMWDSLKKLARLPPETQVYPGHGSKTSIKAEPWLSKAETIFGE
jgi:hydroxyacylglutathione hydrolase